MDPKDRLIKAIINDDKVKRFKELDAIIETHPTLYKEYEELKILQQKFIRANAHKKDAKVEKEAYDNALKKILETPLMSEYLELVEAINMDLKWMTETIESSVNDALGALHEPSKNAE
jgi:cell fate (sporulation/competence/biofilm development) regulator YmcA (YheA/YmcA/DUF963 family)